MPSIQSLGVGSGLLTSELLEKIIAAERESTDLRLNARRAEYEAKISAFGAIRNSVDSLNSAAAALSNSNNLIANAVSSTDENAVTATANATAITGIHSFEVLATAQAQTLSSQRYDSVDEVIGSGTLDIRFGTTTYVADAYDSFTENPDRASGQIVIDSSNNTVAGVRDAINAADLGVVASVVNDGQGFILVLTSDRTGVSNSLEITATEDTPAGLSALNFNLANSTPGSNLTQSVAASDALVVVDGISVTRDTNVIDQVIAGVTFTARSINAGTPASVSINPDTSAITEKIQTFVDSYNTLKTLTDDLTDYDADEGIGALLTGDSTVRTLLSQLRRFMSRGVPQVESTSLRALIDLGISTSQANGYRLNFDSNDFQAALNNDANGVVALLADDRRSTDSQISFVGFQSGTQAGEYAVEVTQAASQAQLSGATLAALDNPVTIDDDNDSLTITVNGTNSGVISLAQGVYASGAELATQIQTQINQDGVLRAAGETVSVTYDTTLQQILISSTRYGSSSNIGIDSVDTNTVAELGLSVEAAENNVGVNVAATVNGIEGNGIGQFLAIPSGPAGETAGQYNAASISTFDTLPVTIDASNNTFRVNIDGFQSADIVLTPGSYASAADVAIEMASQINADVNLSAANKTANVEFDTANNRFEITSATTGVGSRASLTYANAGAVNDLGLTVGIGVAGRNAATLADPAAGIQLRIQGSTVGERGSVTLVRGIMNQIDDFLSEFTKIGGGLANTLSSLDKRNAAIDTEAAEFSKRMNVIEDRLRIQFAAADALISSLNSTSSFLEQQLAALPGYTRDSN